MAYLVHKRDSTWEIRFSINGRRTQITVSGISQGNLELWKENIEHLAVAATNRQAAALEVLAWADALPKSLRSKLEAKDLVGPDPREADEDKRDPTLHKYLDQYFGTKKSDAKQSSWDSYMHTVRCLKEHFPASTRLSQIDPIAAREFRSWMETSSNKRDKNRDGISGNTVRRRTGTCRQIFDQALEDGYIQRNPFAKLPVRVKSVKSRQFYVERDLASRVLKGIDDPQWRVLFVLARYGALRMPSEAVRLEWSHIDFGTLRMLVHQPKIEHHEGRETKIVPLFPEIEVELRELRKVSETDRLFPWLRPTKNLGSKLRRYIEKLNKANPEDQIEPWPKLWQNLRASACTDMARTLPAHVATAICGHTEQIAREHYWMISDSDLDRALNLGQVLEEQKQRIINLQQMRDNRSA